VLVDRPPAGPGCLHEVKHDKVANDQAPNHRTSLSRAGIGYGRDLADLSQLADQFGVSVETGARQASEEAHWFL
jgi:hypothetical protein